MANKTTEQSTPMVLLFLISKWTASRSHLASKFQWSKRNQTLTTERAICEVRRLVPQTADFRKRTRPTEVIRLVETLGTMCCFLLPKTLKVSQNWRILSSLFRVVCLAAPRSLQPAITFYSKRASSSKGLGDIAKRISDVYSAWKIHENNLTLLRGKLHCSTVLLV